MVDQEKILGQIKSVIFAITTFQGEEYVRELCRQRYGFTEEETDAALEEARRRIQAAAQYDLTEELGQALTRNNYLYEAAVKAQDLKTAVRVQRDRAKLLALDAGGSRKENGPVIEYNAEAAEMGQTLDNIRAQLEALGIAPAGLPIEDLTRAAVTRILTDEKRILCLSAEIEKPDTETP